MNRYTLVRLKNLREDFIRSAEWRKKNNIKFNMYAWFTGNSACAIGSACLTPNSKTKKAGLTIYQNKHQFYEPSYKMSADWLALEEFFDLPREVLLEVFLPDCYNKINIKPYDVLRKLDSLIAKVEKGKIN